MEVFLLSSSLHYQQHYFLFCLFFNLYIFFVCLSEDLRTLLSVHYVCTWKSVLCHPQQATDTFSFIWTNSHIVAAHAFSVNHLTICEKVEECKALGLLVSISKSHTLPRMNKSSIFLGIICNDWVPPCTWKSWAPTLAKLTKSIIIKTLIPYSEGHIALMWLAQPFRGVYAFWNTMWQSRWPIRLLD